MLKIIKKYLKKKKKQQRVIEIKKKCGAVTFCSNYKEPLNDKSKCIIIHEDGLYEFTCIQCGTKSRFHYGIAPVPIYFKG